mmetsp:Transcript_62297/g.178758  ORF Transcript_62297/g.178758 Transcript_62297/m.178758 type:complete len:204 (-) Transcript_62297:78-689(-)
MVCCGASWKTRVVCGDSGATSCGDGTAAIAADVPSAVDKALGAGAGFAKAAAAFAPGVVSTRAGPHRWLSKRLKQYDGEGVAIGVNAHCWGCPLVQLVAKGERPTLAWDIGVIKCCIRDGVPEPGVAKSKVANRCGFVGVLPTTAVVITGFLIAPAPIGIKLVLPSNVLGPNAYGADKGAGRPVSKRSSSSSSSDNGDGRAMA